MKAVINLLLAGLLLAGCAGEQDPVRYAESKSNGLRQEISIGEVIYTVQYKPAAYIVQQEHLEATAAAERRKQLEGTAWFNVSFRIREYNQSPLRYKVNGLEEYTARQNYYLNQAPADIYLLYGEDTLYVNSYWFENNQNLSAHETMIVGFRLPDGQDKPERDLLFSFYDRVFRNGIIKAVIRKEDLDDIPAL